MHRLSAVAFALLVAGAASAQMKVPQGAPNAKPANGVSVNGTSPILITPQAQPLPPLSTARRITRLEAIKLASENKAVYIDVRSEQSFASGHIKGAINIPHSQLAARFRDIPPGRMIITYCACVEEHTAALTVLELNSHGFRNTAALAGGWKDWVAAGLPTETGTK
jgi:rhodanese-related sulfurtransferase